MFDRIPLRPDDRVLFLFIPGAAVIANAAGELTEGLLVALGPADQLQAARIAARDLDNVLFALADGNSIPWRDAFFTKIVAPETLVERLQGEITRVLLPGGEVYPINVGPEQ